MTTMNLSLPDELKSYVGEQVSDGGYGSTSEFVRDLIRRDKTANTSDECSSTGPLRTPDR